MTPTGNIKRIQAAAVFFFDLTNNFLLRILLPHTDWILHFAYEATWRIKFFGLSLTSRIFADHILQRLKHCRFTFARSSAYGNQCLPNSVSSFYNHYVIEYPQRIIGSLIDKETHRVHLFTLNLFFPVALSCFFKFFFFFFRFCLPRNNRKYLHVLIVQDRH